MNQILGHIMNGDTIKMNPKQTEICSTHTTVSRFMWLLPKIHQRFI